MTEVKQDVILWLDAEMGRLRPLKDSWDIAKRSFNKLRCIKFTLKAQEKENKELQLKLYNSTPTPDYIEFTNINTPKEKRREFDVGDIYINAVQCKFCDWNIRSKNRHDYVQCKCGKTFVDGGSHYCRSNDNAISHIVMYNDI